MPTRQEEHWYKTVSSELGIQNKPQGTVASETAAHSRENIPATEAKAADQFRFRILRCRRSIFNTRNRTADFGKWRL
jgi:hypothetical protein